MILRRSVCRSATGVFACVLSLTLGCQQPKQNWEQVVCDLDKVAQAVEEWGTITVTEPMIVEHNKQFDLNYSKPTSEYVDAARRGVQGAVRRSSEESLDTQVAFKIKASMDELAGSLQKTSPNRAALGQVRQEVASAVSKGTLQAILGRIELLVPTTQMTPEQSAIFDALTAALSGGSPTDGAGAATDGGDDTVVQAEPAVAAETTPADAAAQPAEPVALPPLPRPAKGVLSTDRFTMPLPIGDLPSSISERQALLIGVNDKTTEILMRELLSPGQRLGDNKRMYLGLLQVACEPGWRTRSGYTAEVVMTVNYARPIGLKETTIYAADGVTFERNEQVPLPLEKWRDAYWVAARQSGGAAVPDEREYTDWRSGRHIAGSPHPQVVSVFPSIEAQTLDLRNSVRSQKALATSLNGVLSKMGLNVQAEFLRDYAKRLEIDVATRNAIPFLNSFSDGGSFGYQIQPALQAIPDLRKSGDNSGVADTVLNPATFPALVVILCDRDLIDSTKTDFWTHLEFLVSSRWVPNSATAKQVRRSEGDRITTASLLDRAKGSFAKAIEDDEELSSDSLAAHEIQRRIKLYETLGIGKSRYVELPKYEPEPKSVALTEVQPNVGWINADTVLTLSGKGFLYEGASLVKQVTVGGVACDSFVVNSETLIAVVPKGAFADIPDPQRVTVSTTKGTDTLWNMVSFSLKKKTVATRDPEIKLTRDASGFVTEIKILPGEGADGDKLLTLLREILRDGKCCENVKVDVSSSSSVK